MSRVGNKPIPLPTGVKVTIGDEMLVEGPKGKLRVPISPGIQAKQADGQLQFTRDSDQHAPVHGLTRALAASAVHGGSAGFHRGLDITRGAYPVRVKRKIRDLTARY